MLRLFRRVGLSRPPPTPVCRLTGCQRPCFLEPSGRLHDFCGITHARVFDNKRIADLDRARWAGQGPGHGHGKRGSGPVPGGRFDENEEYWTEEMVLFWHPPSVFSQWTPATFVVDHVPYSCAEQYMMAEKAKLFGDHDTLRQIMSTDNPSAQKNLGRGVRGYDPIAWDWEKKAIVMRGTYEKFTQNPGMAQHLLDTGEKILAEASPHDAVWGIGLKADDRAAWTKATWRGENLLGVILQEVRTSILIGGCSD